MVITIKLSEENDAVWFFGYILWSFDDVWLLNISGDRFLGYIEFSETKDHPDIKPNRPEAAWYQGPFLTCCFSPRV